MINHDLSLCMGCMSSLEEPGQECPVCGFRAGESADPEYLAPATKLSEQRYLAGRLLSKNKESATYMGYDNEEEMKVWIVEFMPSLLCSRNPATGALREHKAKAGEFLSLKEDFRSLHASLTELSGEAVVPQLAMFEENNTLYIIYRYIQSISFGQYLARSGGGISWSAAKKLFLPLLTSLSNLHGMSIVHRGISPETILVDTKHKLWLFDFGTQELRTAGTEGAELYPGYSAPEQYDPGSWQGSWTDVYSIAAVLYRALTGTMPADADSRRLQDNMLPACELDRAIPMDISDAIQNAMAIRFEDRLQTVDDFTAGLLESVTGNTAVFSSDKLRKTRRPFFRRLAGSRRLPFGIKPGSTGAYVFITAVGTFLALLVVILVLFFAFIMPMLSREAPSSETTSTEQVPTVTVPSFVGIYIDTLNSAEEYKGKFKFVEQREYNNEFPEGVVFDQTPKKGTETTLEVPEVVLFISKGSELVVLPNIVGSNIAFATDILTSMGIVYNIEPVYDPEKDINDVLSTDKPIGIQLRKYKDAVKLYVNSPDAESSSSSSENND